MGKKASDEDKFRDILANLKQDLDPVDNGIYTEVPYQSFMNGLQEIIHEQLDRKSKGLPLIEAPINELKSLTAEQKLDELENIVKPIYERYSVDYEEAMRVDREAISKDDQLAVETAVMGLFRMLSYGQNLPLDAPPIALDAAICLRNIEYARLSLSSGDTEGAVKASLEAGRHCEKVRVRAHEKAAKDGKRLVETRKKGGKATAKATTEEKLLIIEARDKMVKEKEWPKSKAAEAIAAQLRTGTFPGIDEVIDYSGKYVANLRAER